MLDIAPLSCLGCKGSPNRRPGPTRHYYFFAMTSPACSSGAMPVHTACLLHTPAKNVKEQGQRSPVHGAGYSSPLWFSSLVDGAQGCNLTASACCEMVW
eukprot:CAMPEP_0119111540 /NCGR_PEP_ID=MMETSP1180-20130426/36131_1 /TAXON_ID=3052 ORGANISM="Chlamydomonas cf sp, Strain CCMP681" /NCGR_SAMPLE_ID=MMETSP1180 /ASSEMBLY_ACC=CAM_ASM_000741 /LENGTH=98 /DNA_ID=CAMNT_0007098549 /DNA_START=1 /DNA_END=294 /DNA_ORIENTATION=+